MPKRKKTEQPKKPVTEMTTEELAEKVFPKPVLEHLKKLAEETGAKPRRSPRHQPTT